MKKFVDRVQLTVRMEPETAKEVRELALRWRAPVSVVVEALTEHGLAQYNTAACRARLALCVQEYRALRAEIGRHAMRVRHGEVEPE